MGTIGLVSLLDGVPVGFAGFEEMIDREDQRSDHEQTCDAQADSKTFQPPSRGQLLIDALLFFGPEQLVLFDRRATRIDKRPEVFP